MAVALGLDWVVIDAEHGHLDWKEIAEHIRATVRSNTVALVRITELNVGLVKRSLDIGADGVVIPWIETAEQLQDSVRFARYPTEGFAAWAPNAPLRGARHSPSTQAEANEHVFVVPIIETVRAGKNLPAMLEVEGVDSVLVWPGGLLGDGWLSRPVEGRVLPRKSCA